MDWFSSEKLVNEYGLSCVENYALLYLSQKVSRWELLFCHSYLCFEEILECIYNGQKYSSFSGIERVHKIAAIYDILDVKRVECEFSYLEQMESALIAIQVNKEYMHSKYNRAMWRDDHYILINKLNDQCYLFVNDNPKDCGMICKEEIKKMFAGKLIKFELLCTDISDLKKYINKAYECVVYHNPQSRYKNDNWKKLDLAGIRDAVGIMKVIVKRMEGILSLLCDPKGISDYYAYLCECYVKIEYYRMRKKDVEDVQDMLIDIKNRELVCRNQILENMLKGMGNESSSKMIENKKEIVS